MELRCEEPFEDIVTREQPICYRTSVLECSSNSGKNNTTRNSPKVQNPVILFGLMRTPENKLVMEISKPPKPCAV